MAPGDRVRRSSGQRAIERGLPAQVLRRLAGAAAYRRRSGRPLVTLSYAQSIDGCIALAPGRPVTLSGAPASRLTHQLRGAHDALLVGINTVLADNPQLNVRHSAGSDPQPIIVDSHLQLPLDSFLVQNAARRPWVAALAPLNAARRTALEHVGVQVLETAPDEQQRVSLPALLAELGRREINSVMVEGGARILTSMLCARTADHLMLTIVPRLLGGYRAIGALAPLARIALHKMHARRVGEDLLLWGELAWQ